MKKKVSFQLLVKLRRRLTVREENGCEKMIMTSENERKDGMVEHFKEQNLESEKL